MKSIILILLFIPIGAYAEDSFVAENQRLQATETVQDKAETTRRYLPGEEVVTPTGKKVKVWSTEGPVSVSPAPEPFQQKPDANLSGTQIIIDAERRHRRGRN